MTDAETVLPSPERARELLEDFSGASQMCLDIGIVRASEVASLLRDQIEMRALLEESRQALGDMANVAEFSWEDGTPCGRLGARYADQLRTLAARSRR